MPRAMAILVASNTSTARITPPVPGASGSTCRWTSMAPTSDGSVRPRSTGPRTGSTFQSSRRASCPRLGPTANPIVVHKSTASTVNVRDGRYFLFVFITTPPFLCFLDRLRFQLPELIALDLPRGSARQVEPHVDPARILPQPRTLLHVRLERLQQDVVRRVAV